MKALPTNQLFICAIISTHFGTHSPNAEKNTHRCILTLRLSLYTNTSKTCTQDCHLKAITVDLQRAGRQIVRPIPVQIGWVGQFLDLLHWFACPLCSWNNLPFASFWGGCAHNLAEALPMAQQLHTAHASSGTTKHALHTEHTVYFTSFVCEKFWCCVLPPIYLRDVLMLFSSYNLFVRGPVCFLAFTGEILWCCLYTIYLWDDLCPSWHLLVRHSDAVFIQFICERFWCCVFHVVYLWVVLA